MLAVLCSKDFFYLVEGSRNREPAAHQRLGTGLAALVFPLEHDAGRRAAASWPRNGTLHQPEVLRAQVARMLRDPKIARFTDGVSARSGCNCATVGMFPPDKKLYPDYDEYLQKSMVGETTAFFREVLGEESQPARVPRFRLDDAQRAARRALSDCRASRKIAFSASRLQPEDHRGGLLTQAAILSLTSDGTRHRPGASRQVGAGVDHRQAAAAAAGQRQADRADAGDAAEGDAAHEAGRARERRELRVLPSARSIRSAWPSTTTTRSAAGAPRKSSATAAATIRRSTPAASCPTAASSPTPTSSRNCCCADLDKFNAAFVEKLATFACAAR